MLRVELFLNRHPGGDAYKASWDLVTAADICKSCLSAGAW
jgi:hypothetical protein